MDSTRQYHKHHKNDRKACVINPKRLCFLKTFDTFFDISLLSITLSAAKMSLFDFDKKYSLQPSQNEPAFDCLLIPMEYYYFAANSTLR